MQNRGAIEKAEKYIHENSKKCNNKFRPCLHVTAPIGWINDPNGFSFFHGKYHLYGQYNPYDSEWGNIHWGHWVSDDLLHWTWQGVAMAPDKDYDCDGCFSGTATIIEDCPIFMYTGVSHTADGEEMQVQCMAVSETGDVLCKVPDNPLIDGKELALGASKRDFRDPKIDVIESGYRIWVGNSMQNKGCVQTFSSSDLHNWKYEGVYISEQGVMMECPDCFILEDKRVLIACVMNGKVDGIAPEINDGPVIGYIGYEEDGKLRVERKIALDYGVNFYAPQTMITPNGRRILIGWMRYWPENSPTHILGHGWSGQMTLPRELFFNKGKLCQLPVKEVEACRMNGMKYIETASHISVQVYDTSDIHLFVKDIKENRIEVRCYEEQDEYFIIVVDAREKTITLDRSKCETVLQYTGVGDSKSIVTTSIDIEEHLDLRIILDYSSVEVFVQGGEKVMTALCYPEKQGRTFSIICEEPLEINLETYQLT